MRGYALEKETGQTYYEVELRLNRHSKDALIDTTGAVVEVEEEVAFAKAHVVTAGKRSEIQVGPDGKPPATP